MSELIRTIALNTLERSPDNVRKTPAGTAAAVELEASIAAHGLLENLLVRPLATPPGEAERYAVIAGARRLSALQRLADAGKLAPDHPVPCRLIDAGADEHELSLAENVVRTAMHPADQVQAFAALAAKGATAAAIAARFGVSERTVEQRLRLGTLAPELLDAYRDEQLSMDTLMAFTLSTDPERQLAVWAQLADHHAPSAWSVKRLLTEERVQGGQSLARFVGLEAYEAAGGPCTRDLFAEQDERGVWLDDPALLRQLATAKLEPAAQALRADWAWVEVHLDADWNTTARYANVYPKPGVPTDEENEELERLNTRRDELDNLDDDAWTDALDHEYRALEARLFELENLIDSRAAYRPEHQALAGCIVTVNHGAVRVIEGLVRPTDALALANASAGDDDDHSSAISGITPPLASPVDPARGALAAAGVGRVLADDLRAIRTGDVKAALAGDFEAAFDLLVFQLARALFRSGYHTNALDIAANETLERPVARGGEDEPFTELDVREQALRDAHAQLNLTWLREANDEDAFAQLCALPTDDKQRLLAACVASTVKGQLAFEHGARPELEAVVARLDIDFAARFRPSAERFWQRLTKARMLEIARDVLGEPWAQAHAKDKKAPLADAMAGAFAPGGEAVPGGLTADTRRAALAWAPPGFKAFDAGREDPAQPAEPIEAGRTDTSGSSETADHTAQHLDPDSTPALPAGGADPADDTGPDPSAPDGLRITVANGGRDITVERERACAPAPGNAQTVEPSGGAEDAPAALPAFLRGTP